MDVEMLAAEVLYKIGATPWKKNVEIITEALTQARAEGYREGQEGKWLPIPYDDEDAEKRGIDWPPSDTPILMGMMQSSAHPNPEWVYHAGIHHCTKGGWVTSGYTHWQPLPPAPKGQDDDQ